MGFSWVISLEPYKNFNTVVGMNKKIIQVGCKIINWKETGYEEYCRIVITPTESKVNAENQFWMIVAEEKLEIDYVSGFIYEGLEHEPAI